MRSNTMKLNAPQPRPLNAARRVGVEIELSGLTEPAIAGTVMHVLGGCLSPMGATRLQVKGSAIGDIVLELDTKFQSALVKAPPSLLNIAREVIPSEIITEPIWETDLARLDHLVHELRVAGAEGSRAGLAKGFGVHFNPEVQTIEPEPIVRTLQAYALLEPWLRDNEPMTVMRRMLPFTEEWPDGLRSELIAVAPKACTLPGVIDLYLRHARSRNYGLDMLPLWAHLDRNRIAAAVGEDAPSGRPTYHFRLPTSRIDEARWRITDEWAKWQLVEAVAEDGPRLSAMRRAWLDTPDHWLGGKDRWVERCEDFLPHLVGA